MKLRGGQKIQIVAAATLGIVAAVVALIVVALWVTSYWAPPYFRRVSEARQGERGGSMQIGMAAQNGRAHFAFVLSELVQPQDRYPAPTVLWQSGWLATNEQDNTRYTSPRWIAWLGMKWRWRTVHTTDAQGTYNYIEFFGAFSFALLTALIVSGLALSVLWRRRLTRPQRRARRGLCPFCGYDLRGGGERCPECGAVIAPDVIASS